MKSTPVDRLDTAEERMGASGHAVDGGAAATASADGSEGKGGEKERAGRGKSERGVQGRGTARPYPLALLLPVAVARCD
jgi:hypothetical protein